MRGSAVQRKATGAAPGSVPALSLSLWDLTVSPWMDAAHRGITALARNTVTPRIEMGHFLYAVRNRPADALGQFEDAERLARAGLKDALVGKVQCLAELGRGAEARIELASAMQLFPDDTDLGLLRAELEDGDDGA